MLELFRYAAFISYSSNLTESETESVGRIQGEIRPGALFATLVMRSPAERMIDRSGVESEARFLAYVEGLASVIGHADRNGLKRAGNPGGYLVGVMQR